MGPGGVCVACNPAQVGANGYQFKAGGAVCAARCIPLAFPTSFLSAHPLNAADPMGGVVVSFGGGTGGRKLIHRALVFTSSLYLSFRGYTPLGLEFFLTNLGFYTQNVLIAKRVSRRKSRIRGFLP